jgi:hypothetical protein
MHHQSPGSNTAYRRRAALREIRIPRTLFGAIAFGLGRITHANLDVGGRVIRALHESVEARR